MTLDELDRTGLIREAYNIDGITDPECRSIFVDWALKLPSEIPARDAIEALHDHYGKDAPDHPMTNVLSEGLTANSNPKRRGGRKARLA